jgi:N utilization substance protein B
MLSRRNIRIKVMQLLFSHNRDGELKSEQLIELYESGLKHSFDLYLFNIYSLLEVCRCSVEDAEKRHAKYLPSEEDKNFTAKLHDNPLIQSLVGNRVLQRLIEERDFKSKIDEDVYRKIYSEFSSLEEYVKYVGEKSTQDDHVQMLLEVYRKMRKNEYFNEIAEDLYFTWIDDKSLVVGAIKKTIKSLPAKNGFHKEYELAEDTELFGRELITYVDENTDKLESMISPTLQNWDMERLAILDMILLKMGIIEFLKFPTIPTKVTLNEYVEIAKMYSTAKSKDFINGILDKIMRELDRAGEINKEGRGLVG